MSPAATATSENLREQRLARLRALFCGLMILTCLAAFLGTLLGLPQGAAGQALRQIEESDEPLEINADDGIEWNRNDKTYIARGNARAASGEIEVLAEVLTAYYREGEGGDSEIFLLEATGDVSISSPEGTVYGDKGQYKLDEQVFVMTGGDLRMEGEKDRLTARDSLEYWEGKQQAVARGNANAYHEDKHIRADVLTANFFEGAESKMEVQRIDAKGNVQIRTKTDVVTGDQGVYYVDRELATLTGQVRITREKNQLNGEYAEVNLATGISKLKGAAPGSETPGRVTAIVLPKSKAKLDPKAPLDSDDDEEEPAGQDTSGEETPQAGGGS
ncbi:LptA/OstA family protein [Pelagibius sp.]|uniref:LptA/OstA family protein n=1 Tax=Pelagibius sp. TaxID=1931238 RepID=UPI002611137E|nr:LptA/OstA family protein [Pelagibius sp.]